MGKHAYIPMALAGAAAGAVTGLFGGGGGMVLIPLLTLVADLEETEVFASSISIILPICLVSLFLSAGTVSLTRSDVLPWMAGSAMGGLLAGLWGRRIPAMWLHRSLGILILWGGWRYLWS